MLDLITRYLFVCAALLVFASGAFAAGAYQHTKDGKTTVWNNDPKPGDEAAWSGDRDGEGCAAGFGTLTWYTGQKKTVKRLGILPVTNSRVYARYFGNMVRGKFNGPVNVHTNGKTAHAFFIDGIRADRWLAGPAPSRKISQPGVEVAKQEIATEPASTSSGVAKPAIAISSGAPEPVSAKHSGVAEPAAPAEGPVKSSEVRSQRTEIGSQESAVRSSPRRIRPSADQRSEVGEQKSESTERIISKPTPAKKSQAEVEESLFSLVGPPSSLHTNPDAGAVKQEAAFPSADSRLTKEEVVDLADAGARTRGYNPAEYERAEPQYKPADQVWSINYEQKPFDETMESGKRFSVTVDDKTKGTVFVPGK